MCHFTRVALAAVACLTLYLPMPACGETVATAAVYRAADSGMQVMSVRYPYRAYYRPYGYYGRPYYYQPYAAYRPYYGNRYYGNPYAYQAYPYPYRAYRPYYGPAPYYGGYYTYGRPGFTFGFGW